MFPYISDYFREIGLDNYRILYVTAILAALLCFRTLASKTKMPTGAYNFYLLTGILSIGVGLFSAFLFQAIYNFAESGKFELKGMTVMGGLLGAAIFFVLFTFVVSRTKFASEHKPLFWTAVNLIIPGIVIAQSIGRIGCFAAGCCYGRETDSWLGVIFIRGYLSNGNAIYHENPRLPTQLFEAFFMLALFIAMLVVMFRFKKSNLSALMYLFAYPIFRFCIEFFRDDHRGAWLMGMSPSQIQSLGLLLLGIALVVLIYVFKIVPFAGKASVAGQENDGQKDKAEGDKLSLEIMSEVAKDDAEVENALADTLNKID